VIDRLLQLFLLSANSAANPDDCFSAMAEAGKLHRSNGAHF
jgi:hypothetical protein